MKLTLQYVNDANGRPKAVQMAIGDWEKVLSYIRKSEQAFKLRSDLKIALEQAEVLRKSKENKQSLTDFLNDL